MSTHPDSSKHVPPKRTLPIEIIGALALLFAGSFLVALFVSPGGDPYSMTLFTAVIYPASIAAYWLGFRQGKTAKTQETPNSPAQIEH